MCVCKNTAVLRVFKAYVYIYNYIYTLHTQLSEREAMIENDEKVV